MDLKDIKAIIDLMRKNAVSEFELERQDFKIRLKRGVDATALSVSGNDTGFISAPVAAPPPAQVAPVAPPSPAAALPAAPTPAVQETEIKSPMIGTFYRAPSPESAPYVEVGTEVQPDTVVCIIEAMKVMNEIKAEARGVITDILVANAKPVEFGQPLFKLRPL